MRKYTTQLIEDYIQGNEITDYTLDELENDKEFMMLAMSYTNDSKLYNLCSDDLKNDSEFVKFLIVKFKDDLNFICEVADNYLANNEDELSTLEIAIMMRDLTGKNKQLCLKYALFVEATYTSKRVEIEAGKIEIANDRLASQVGMGFYIMFDLYSSSEIVLNYFAKKTIDEIFNEFDIDLEQMLHERFKSPIQIDRMGINNFMLDFIGCYDPMLSSYLTTHLDLMDDLRHEIRECMDKWNNYYDTIEREKYNEIIDRVHEYMVQIEDKIYLSEAVILYYIAKKLGIIEIVAKYDGISEETCESILEDYDVVEFEEFLAANPQERFTFNTLLNMVSSIAFEDNRPKNENDPKIIPFKAK